MRNMKKVEITETEIGQVLHRIDKEWMLVTAGTADDLNTMTASWGGIGVLWSRYMVNIFVRPERHTYGYVEKSDYFSVAFFSPEYKKQLALCGSKSGREIDKVKECGFTVNTGGEGGVYFDEADLALICRKRYRDPIALDHIIGLDPAEHYSETRGGVHVMYMGEIVEVYTR